MQKFLDTILGNGLLPSITRPTRIVQQSATLIDSIFISEVLQWNFDSALLIYNISDHLPIITLMKQTKIIDKNPIEFHSRKLRNEKIATINQKLHGIDWNRTLNSENCNVNFNRFCETLHNTMDAVAPLIHVKISRKRRYTEQWMTQGIETSSRCNLQIYKETIQSNSTETDNEKYKAHCNILNHVKRNAKINYYIDNCNQYKNNTRKLWQVINQIIGKQHPCGSIIPYISINNIKTYDPKRISNKFGSFYANLGSNFAKQINPGKTSIEDYINRIPRALNSMAMLPTTQHEVAKLMKGLPNKSSSGHDQINNTLLKN